ncbi:hypothetical protein IJ670_05850 [bacterium]|nr:hypothetical protein [bacterium]
MKNFTLFLDFDGVLFDTIREVYLINRFVYRGIDLKHSIDEKNYKLFSKYKYLVYNIWMFYYYNPLIFNEIAENEIPNEFQKNILKRNKKQEEDFCLDFLDARRRLINNDYEFWKNLEIPYQFFYNVKKLYEKEKINLVVVSKKNKKSIQERFETYDFKLDENNIFAREILDQYPSKGAFLNEYMQKNDIEQAIFVDDNINNLKTVDNPKIKTILALWGNVEPNSVGMDEKEAFDFILHQDKNWVEHLS